MFAIQLIRHLDIRDEPTQDWLPSKLTFWTRSWSGKGRSVGLFNKITCAIIQHPSFNYSHLHVEVPCFHSNIALGYFSWCGRFPFQFSNFLSIGLVWKFSNFCRKVHNFWPRLLLFIFYARLTRWWELFINHWFSSFLV